MMEFLHQFQLSVMLFLSGACGVLIILTQSTKTLTKRRKGALLYMQISAMILLIADRFAYLYRGDESQTGYWMVRVCNFLVYLLSLTLAHAFNQYLMELYRNEVHLAKLPKRFAIGETLFTIGVIFLGISQITGWYYTFDSSNRYQRGPFIVLAYIFPLSMIALQFSVNVQYRKRIRRRTYVPLLLFTVFPFIACILQFFLYGLSLTNITMVGMVVQLYFSEILNMNDLQDAKIAAEKANTAKSRFLSNISHEIRTPINTIMGMNEMILREEHEAVPEAYYNNIMKHAKDIEFASESLLSLINDVLDISQIESGKMRLVEQEYDVEEFLRDIINMVRVRSDAKEIRFDVDIDEELPRRLFGDMGKIKQIVLNFLTNALKYTEEGGIEIKVKVLGKDEDSVTIQYSVTDTGQGIKEEDMKYLFNAFESLEEVKNSNIRGSGLGLDISKHFADLMNGELTCESEYGKGSTFTFIVRQIVVDPTEIGFFEEKVEETEKGPYIPRFVAPDISILVVDDNPMNLAVIKGLLANTKMYIVTADSGEECLVKLEESQYNLVLLDHMMPGMDGLETCKRIREKYPDLPVIALTANYIANGKEYYISKGFTGYLPKPVDGQTLENIIRLYLPDDAVMDSDVDAVAEFIRLPHGYEWLNDVDGINVDDGIKYSGGAESFVFSLKLFFDTIEENSEVLNKAFSEGDIKLFTIKVHALKSSARIIGAHDLSEKAKWLEDAGKKNDVNYINDHFPEMLAEYKSYADRLAKFNPSVDNSNKEPIPEDELMGAIEALKELVPQMDFDSVEMVVNDVMEYKLPDEEEQLFTELAKALRTFNWDKMEELLKDK